MRNPAKFVVRFCIAACLGGSVALLADLNGSYIMPLDNESIGYTSRQNHDPVQRLNERIARGEVKLSFDDRHGYLRSVLDALKVPIESQLLVFSKTSFQASRIS